MRTLLVVTYYWPPAGGVAVQRVAKFCKYLPNFGWRPVILTVDGGNYDTIDNETARDIAHVAVVRKVAGFEPHSLYRALGGGTQRSEDPQKPRQPSPIRRSFEALAESVRLNLFVPDTRIGWLRPAVRAGLELIRTEKVNAIFSTAPPFTTHLVAQQLHRKSGLPWLTDFRDPWLENTVYNRRRRLPWVMKKNRRLETSVLEEATAVVCVGAHLAALLDAKTPSGPGAHVIPNGYDEEELSDAPNTRSDRFYLSYYGTLYPQRLPHALFTAIRELVADDAILRRDLSVRIFGNLSPGAQAHIVNALGQAHVSFSHPLPRTLYQQSLHEKQVLLLSIDDVPNNELILLGKTFDYLPTGNPILGIGPPEGDAARLLSDTGTGRIFAYQDTASVKSYIQECYARWEQGSLNVGKRRFPHLTRKDLTQQLAVLLDGVVGKAG